jgi:8-oxo-dGTP diphosphatase
MQLRAAVVFGSSPAAAACRDRFAAYAIVRNPRGAVAVVTACVRGRDEVWLPGGGMLNGESPHETIVREVREELGREIRLNDQVGRAIQYFYAGDQNCWYRMQAYFICGEFGDGPVSPCEYELRWVDPVLQASDFFHECHVWAARNAGAQAGWE